MDLLEYQQGILRTSAVSDRSEMLELALIGLSGELGEIAEPIKKHLFSGHSLDIGHLQQEIGDVLWYLGLLCNALDLSLVSALEEGVKRLRRRSSVALDRSKLLKFLLIGLSGELGKIAESLEEYLYYVCALNVGHLQQEIGDVLWRLSLLCSVLDISLASALEENVKKLRRRYPDGFSSERSRERNGQCQAEACQNPSLFDRRCERR